MSYHRGREPVVFGRAGSAPARDPGRVALSLLMMLRPESLDTWICRRHVAGDTRTAASPRAMGYNYSKSDIEVEVAGVVAVARGAPGGVAVEDP